MLNLQVPNLAKVHHMFCSNTLRFPNKSSPREKTMHAQAPSTLITTSMYGRTHHATFITHGAKLQSNSNMRMSTATSSTQNV
jgi:hypothetical protein